MIKKQLLIQQFAYAIFHVRRKIYLRDSLRIRDRVGLIERPVYLKGLFGKFLQNVR